MSMLQALLRLYRKHAFSYAHWFYIALFTAYKEHVANVMSCAKSALQNGVPI